LSGKELAEFSLSDFYVSSGSSQFLEKLIVGILVLLILGIPLPFGSVQPFWIFIIEVVSTVCFFLWILRIFLYHDRSELERFREIYTEEKERYKQQPLFNRNVWLARLLRLFTFGRWPRRNVAENLVVEGEEEPQALPRRLAFHSVFGFPVRNTGVEVLVLIFLGMHIFQLIPLPSFLVRMISPTTANLYSTAAEATGKALRFYPLSVDAFATFSGLLQYIAYFMIYIVVVNAVRTRILYWTVLYTIFVAGVFQGVYGLYEYLSGHHHIFAYEKEFNRESASGTFINRNHYAAYLELSLPLLITVVMGRLAMLKARTGSIGARIAHALETQGSQVILALFMVVLVAVGLIFSFSRSGISFGIISLIVFFFIYWRLREELSRKTYLILGILTTVALAVWIGLDPLLERFLKISLEWTAEGSRWNVYKDTFYMFTDFPVIGAGAGTFEQVFPMYRTFVQNLFYTYAHNDYVQFLAESGLLVIFLFVALLEVLYTRLKRVMSRDISRLVVVQIGAFCSLLSLALHSFTDFGFHIPAIAIQGIIIAGLFFSHYEIQIKKVRVET